MSTNKNEESKAFLIDTSTWKNMEWFGKATAEEKYRMKTFLLNLDNAKKVDPTSERVKNIREGMNQIMEGIRLKIEQLDKRFSGRVIPMGSAHNDMKMGDSDEFDFVYETGKGVSYSTEDCINHLVENLPSDLRPAYVLDCTPDDIESAQYLNTLRLLGFDVFDYGSTDNVSTYEDQVGPHSTENASTDDDDTDQLGANSTGRDRMDKHDKDLDVRAHLSESASTDEDDSDQLGANSTGRDRMDKHDKDLDVRAHLSESASTDEDDSDQLGPNSTGRDRMDKQDEDLNVRAHLSESVSTDIDDTDQIGANSTGRDRLDKQDEDLNVRAHLSESVSTDIDDTDQLGANSTGRDRLAKHDEDLDVRAYLSESASTDKDDTDQLGAHSTDHDRMDKHLESAPYLKALAFYGIGVFDIGLTDDDSTYEDQVGTHLTDLDRIDEHDEDLVRDHSTESTNTDEDDTDQLGAHSTVNESADEHGIKQSSATQSMDVLFQSSYSNRLTPYDYFDALILAHILDEVMPNVELPQGWCHGGFNRPEYSGLRKSGPALMLQFDYLGTGSDMPLRISVDFVPVARRPLSDMKANTMDVLFEFLLKEHYLTHFWASSCKENTLYFSQGEEAFLREYSADSVPKTAIRCCKALLSLVSQSAPKCPTRSTVLEVVVYLNQKAQGNINTELLDELAESLTYEELEKKIPRTVNDQLVTYSDLGEAGGHFEYLKSYLFKRIVMTAMVLDDTKGHNWTEEDLPDLVMSVFMIINDLLKTPPSHPSKSQQAEEKFVKEKLSIPIAGLCMTRDEEAPVVESKESGKETNTESPRFYFILSSALNEYKCMSLLEVSIFNVRPAIFLTSGRKYAGCMQVCQLLQSVCEGKETAEIDILTPAVDEQQPNDHPVFDEYITKKEFEDLLSGKDSVERIKERGGTAVEISKVKVQGETADEASVENRAKSSETPSAWSKCHQPNAQGKSQSETSELNDAKEQNRTTTVGKSKVCKVL